MIGKNSFLLLHKRNTYNHVNLVQRLSPGYVSEKRSLLCRVLHEYIVLKDKYLYYCKRMRFII